MAWSPLQSFTQSAIKHMTNLTFVFTFRQLISLGVYWTAYNLAAG